MEERLIKIGDTAPDFTLQNQHKVDVNLNSLRGNRVLLSFHPLHGPNLRHTDENPGGQKRRIKKTQYNCTWNQRRQPAM